MRWLQAFLFTSILLGPTAQADWKKVATTHSRDYLMAFTRFAQKQILIGGLRIDDKSGFPIPSTVLYWSQDGGLTFQQVKSVPGGGGLVGGTIADLFAIDSKNLWALSGDTVYFADNIGAPWKPKKLGGRLVGIHMFDKSTGLIIGQDGEHAAVWRTEDGGVTWNMVATGIKGTPACMFWLDQRKGFAAGARTTEQDPNNTGQMQTVYHEGFLLTTTDGGRTWSQLSSPTSGHALCPLFFLNEKVGFLASAEYNPDAGRAGPAHLWKTTDGGKTFSDMNIPVTIGRGLFNMPIQVSYFTVMFWADEMNGHLGGDAYVMDVSSGGGSSTPPIYKLADYITRDGGQTWTHTDLGTLNIDLSGGSLPPTDGRVMAGELSSMVEGFMVGETGAVYAYELKCTTHEDCGYGYACGTGSKCVPVIIPDTCTECCTNCSETDTISGEISTTDTWGEDTAPIDASVVEGGGCMAGAASVLPLPWLILSLICLFRRQR